jgi:hypothetical protein
MRRRKRLRTSVTLRWRGDLRCWTVARRRRLEREVRGGGLLPLLLLRRP